MDRAMFFYERFLFLSGRVTWNVAITVRLRGPLERDAIAAALAGLQRRHSALCAGVKARGGRPWFVTTEPVPAIGLEEVVRRDDETWFATAWVGRHRPFALGAGPLARLIWIRPEAGNAGRCELVLVAHHCICDGASMVLLMRELLQLLGDPAASPARAPTPGLAPDRRRASVRDSAMLAFAWTTLPLAGLLPRRRRGADYAIRWELDRALVAALDRRCRTERATATMVYAAALLLAFRSVSGPRAKNRLLCPVDMRALLPEIGRGELFAFAETVMLSLDDEPEFWERARLLRERLVAGRALLDPARRIALAERLHAALGGLLRLQLDGRVKQDAALSVLPPLNFPPGDGATTLEAALDPLGVMPWRDATGLTVLRDRGRVRMILVTREDLLSRAAAARIRDAMVTTLTAACGLDGAEADEVGRLVQVGGGGRSRGTRMV